MRRKNKKHEERLRREEHRERLRNARRLEPDLQRKPGDFSENPLILIVCEGKNTEPSYFNQFKLPSATLEVLGEGYNTLSLVEKTIELKSRKDFDQVWCVFDKDDFKDADFNNAIAMAEANGFGIAYSNQAFEYWLLLHLQDHQGGGMHRSLYPEKINAFLNPFKITYDGTGSKKIEEDFFDHMFAREEISGRRRVDLAIERAERIYNRLDHYSPAQEESSTTVFRLVRELMKYM